MAETLEVNNVQSIISDLDKLINELTQLRGRVAALSISNQNEQSLGSVRDAEWFGMWADRQDMQGISSRDWLRQLRTQQWGR
jgi:hypothetical protein